MNVDIRDELAAVADPESMCELLHVHCADFGTIRAIDVVPLPPSLSTGVACIVDMESATDARAALAALSLTSFGPRSLVCVVDAPRFRLTFPYRYAGTPSAAARSAESA
jgi:hypothetical protein